MTAGGACLQPQGAVRRSCCMNNKYWVSGKIMYKGLIRFKKEKTKSIN